MSKLQVVLILFICSVFLSVSNQAQNVNLVKNFEGIPWNGIKPPDPDIAAGPNHIALTVNNEIRICNKDGVNLGGNTLRNWFSSLGISEDPVDPKIVFNNYCERWIVFAITRSSALYLLSVSKTSDPMGEWYHYKFDALERDQGGYNYPPDYTGLGYNSEAVYITSNHLNDYVPTHDFQWAKIKAIKLSDLTSGATSPSSKDFRKMQNKDGTSAKNIKPVDYQFGSSTDFYLVNTGSESGDFINIWKISDPFGSNASITRTTVNIGSYSSPNDAPQTGSAQLIETNDSRISDCTYNDGFIYGCFHSRNSFNNGSAVRYFKLRVSDYSLIINGVIEQEGIYYYYPEIYPDKYGNIVCMFNKSSSTNYVGLAWTYRLSDATAVGPISWLQQGQGYYDRLNGDSNRWGDYNGICLDPADHNKIWFVGEYAKSGNVWGTMVGAVKFDGIPEQVAFTNLIGNDNAGGSFTVEGIPNPIPSGQSATLIQGKPYTVSTNNERFSNWMNSGITYKHHDWNTNNYEYLLKHSFTAGGVGAEHQDAFFLNLNHCTINVLVDGQLISGKGSCEFYDPWFVQDYNNTQPGNFWKQFNSYYEPNGKEGAAEKGIFLAQLPELGKYYSARALLMQSPDFGGSLGIRNCYFQSWNSSGANLLQTDNNPAGYDQKAIVFNTRDATITANYKGSLLSNTTSSFANTNQRKFIRTPDGSLHVVYESMGYVWYERSPNGGSSWIMMNGGKPLSTYPSKSPSIDYNGNSDVGTVGIVFQEESPSSGRMIKYFPVHYSRDNYGNVIFSSYALQDIDYVDGLENSSIDSSPVIAFGFTSPYFLVVWKGLEGLTTKYFDGNNSNAIAPLSSSSVLYSVSDQISEHPFLVSNKLGNTGFHLAWDQNTSTTSGTIRYCKLSAGTTVDVVQGSYNSNVSSGSGFSKNSLPGMIPASDNTVRMSWLGSEIYDMTSAVVRGMYSDGSWNPRFWSFGSNVASQCINQGSDGYYILFSDYISGIYQNQFTDSRTLSNIYTLNTTGKDVQLNNGAGDNSRTMFAMSYSSQGSLPYTFTKSANSIGSYYGLYKENSKETSGRTVVLKADSLPEFYFSLQDITLDGKPVKFMKVSDSLRIPDVNSMNKYMTTEPFTLTDNSKFLFNLNYGVTDSVKGINALGKEGNISCNVDLIDEDGNILQNLNKVSFSKDSFLKHKKGSFQVNMQGIGNKTVRLRLRTEVNFTPECFLVDSHSMTDDNGSLYKSSETEKLDYSGEKVIKEYALSRNYPNPFNPSTVIDFEVPKTSKVTLKVFDMLGKEVTTLVNEVKEMGRYKVEFNASSLPSGTYIYEIRANDFVKSGKMMLLK